MSSDYPFVICRPLYCLSYFNVCLLITTLVSFGHCIICPTSMYAYWLPLCYMLAIVSSVLLQCMPSDYPFVICWPLYRLSYFNAWVFFWTFFFWPLYCLSFDIQLFVYYFVNYCMFFVPFLLAIVLSILRYTAFVYYFLKLLHVFWWGPFSFGHCIVYP